MWGEKLLPATALGTSAITIRETSTTTTGSSATAASQTYTGMLNGHPEIMEMYLIVNLLGEKIIRLRAITYTILETPTFHYTTLCHQAHKRHPQHLWGRQTPAVNRTQHFLQHV